MECSRCCDSAIPTLFPAVMMQKAVGIAHGFSYHFVGAVINRPVILS